MYVISSKKFKSINDALVQILKWDKKGTLDSKAHIYKVIQAIRPKISYSQYKKNGEKIPKGFFNKLVAWLKK